ncbi:MAG: hypothetical protein IPK60_12725 [Sandaracinaceae bacterium]|jgi:hypothetical protein|nr:hypothetical protein [Sandaracinaceae bacterium]
MSSYSDSLIDKRVLKRNVAKGLVDAKEHDKNIKALPDQADNAETVGFDDDDSDLDTDGDDDTEE